MRLPYVNFTAWKPVSDMPVWANDCDNPVFTVRCWILNFDFGASLLPQLSYDLPSLHMQCQCTACVDVVLLQRALVYGP